MKTADEIKLFQKVYKILSRGYGLNMKPHKTGISWDCRECQASMACSVIENHIELLRWWETKKKDKKK